MTEKVEMSATEKKHAKLKSTSEVVENSNKQQLIYFGPSLKNLQQYQVFIGDLPSHVKKHIEINPALKELFVEPKELPLIQRNLKIKGTREQQLYDLVHKTKGANSNAL
ncbi:hypothetical protein [Psychrobacillus sp. FSL K6-1464]|uniref:hypothetical protein n=1 Tax=Psychrobacillus sp. FSL K6-1464 TaxID=2921545 RepID=UPI0030FA57F9